MNLTFAQQRKLRSKAVSIAERLGRAAGDAVVRDEGCPGVGLMGRYEYENLGLPDLEPEFSQRLSATLERVSSADPRFSAELEQEVWRVWIYARNKRVKELCPRAREYGDEG